MKLLGFFFSVLFYFFVYDFIICTFISYLVSRKKLFVEI